MEGNAEREAPDMRAHRLASEMVTRLKNERALGTPSFYNIAREVMIEEFAPALIDGTDVAESVTSADQNLQLNDGDVPGRHFARRLESESKGTEKS